MTITLNSDYDVTLSTALLGYVGETNARPVSVEGMEIDGADRYVLTIDYGDGVQYEVDITGGTWTPTADILRSAQTVSCQICAKKLSGDEYILVKKSRIFRLRIGAAIGDNAVPSPDVAMDALDRIDAIGRQAHADMQTAVAAAETATTAAENAKKSATNAGVSADTATQAANRAETAKTAAETSATQAETAMQGAETARAEAVTAQNAAKISAAQASASAQQTTADKTATAGYAQTAKTNADSTAADRQAVQTLAEQVTADKVNVTENAAQVAADRKAAETAAQTAQAVADSLPDDYVTAVGKIAENTTEINNTNTEVSELKSDLTELNDTVFEIETHEETEIIPLSFTHDGWYSDKQFYNTNDGKYASVDVNAGEVYYVKGRTLWNFSPYLVLDSDGDIIYSGQPSNSSKTYNREETLTIPQNGTKLIFSAPANDTEWQSFCSCIKHTIITTKTDKVEENRTDIEAIKNGLYVTEDCQENITLDWINGGCYNSNGSFTSDGGYDYVLLDIVAGDRYVFDYFSIYTVTYVIFDENNKVLKHGNTSGSSTWTEYNEDIIAPAGSRKLALTITSNRPSSQFNKSYVHHFYKRESSIKDYLIKELEKSNILYGKKWFATGDSFTHGSLVDPDENPIFQDGRYMGKRKTYPYFIGLRNNMEIINDGLSGSTLATIKSGDTYTTDPFSVSRYLAIPEDVDYITIWFGINDANHCALGTIEDETNATFYGAYNIVLRWIITNRPNAKVGLIVTNLSTESFRQATRDIAHKWGIPYLDMMGDYQSPPIVGGREESLGMCEEATNLRTNHFHISESNMHPTVNAHRYQSTFIEAFLRRL